MEIVKPKVGDRVSINGETPQITKVEELLEGCKYNVDLLYGERIEAVPIHDGPVRPAKPIDNSVYVVTDPENGWSCVCGVYSTLRSAVESCGGEYEECKDYYSYEFESKIIHQQELEF